MRTEDILSNYLCIQMLCLQTDYFFQNFCILAKECHCLMDKQPFDVMHLAGPPISAVLIYANNS